MLIRVGVQEPTISVCHDPPYARACGFALIAKLPVTSQPMTPQVSERASAFRQSGSSSRSMIGFLFWSYRKPEMDVYGQGHVVTIISPCLGELNHAAYRYSLVGEFGACF